MTQVENKQLNLLVRKVLRLNAIHEHISFVPESLGERIQASIFRNEKNVILGWGRIWRDGYSYDNLTDWEVKQIKEDLQRVLWDSE